VVFAAHFNLGLALQKNGRIDDAIRHLSKARRLVPSNLEVLSRNHWITLKVIGKKSNRDALGTKVSIKSGDLVQSDQLRDGGSYLAMYVVRDYYESVHGQTL
jgi:tetratricopeptide (TPR) repeat protein